MNTDAVTNVDAGAPDVTAHFFVAGRDFDSAGVTKSLGLEPTEIWQQPRPELRKRTDLANVCWKYGFKKKPFTSISDAVNEVLEVVWPLRDHVARYVSKNRVQVGIECTVTIHADRPVYELSSTVISRLADLRCEFLLDIFDYLDQDN